MLVCFALLSAGSALVLQAEKKLDSDIVAAANESRLGNNWLPMSCVRVAGIGSFYGEPLHRYANGACNNNYVFHPENMIYNCPHSNFGNGWVGPDCKLNNGVTQNSLGNSGGCGGTDKTDAEWFVFDLGYTRYIESVKFKPSLTTYMSHYACPTYRVLTSNSAPASGRFVAQASVGYTTIVDQSSAVDTSQEQTHSIGVSARYIMFDCVTSTIHSGGLDNFDVKVDGDVTPCSTSAPLPTPPPTPPPTPSPTPSPAPATPLCQYSPRAVQMNTDTVPGDFQGTDDSCVSGGGYSPPPTGTYFGHITADQFHGHSQKVGCLEFTLDVDAYIETRYGRHAAWSTTCPITIFVDATRHSDTSVTGTVIDEIDSATPGYYSKVFTSSTYAAGTQFMMCEGKDNSICGMTVDYIKIYGNAAAAGPSAGGAAAVGDPHLQNVHGERFDLMKPGKHVLINIPRGVGAEKSLLHVQADARHLGGVCADMYFQEVNVTGSWASAKKAGGYHYSVKHGDVETPEWVAFGKVGLKVVHGRTDSGLSYLNVYVKHLGRAGFAVGGLLGEDDHEDVITPSANCAKSMSLLETGEGGRKAPSRLSVAEASLA